MGIDTLTDYFIGCMLISKNKIAVTQNSLKQAK